MRKSIIAACVASALGTMGLNSSRGADAPAAPVKSDRVVVMISLDGFAGFYMDDPKAEIPMLRELASKGTRAESMRAVAPTVTWPNHTTLVTGDFPARHGVVGNNYFDRETKKRITLIADPLFDKDQIVKVPTIYDIASEHGIATLGVRWPATRNARTLNWTTPDISDGELREKYTTPELTADAKKAGVWSEGVVEDPEKPKIRQVPDESCTKIFNVELHEHRPGLALLHLINIDHIEHLNGPQSPEAYAAIKEADGQVKEVWEQMQRDYLGKATLFVVSDHGFSLIKHIVLPNVVLREAKLATVKGTRLIPGDVNVVPQGGCAMIYIADNEKHAETLEKVRAAFKDVKGVEKIVGVEEFSKYGFGDPKKDPHAPDLALFAEDGYAFGDTAAGALSFVEKPERSGTHGHNPDLPILHATFIAAGAGIKPGTKIGEIQNTDVAPTIAKMLNLPMPDVDGKVLSEILEK